MIWYQNPRTVSGLSVLMLHWNKIARAYCWLLLALHCNWHLESWCCLEQRLEPVLDGLKWLDNHPDRLFKYLFPTDTKKHSRIGSLGALPELAQEISGCFGVVYWRGLLNLSSCFAVWSWIVHQNHCCISNCGQLLYFCHIDEPLFKSNCATEEYSF